MRQKVREEKGDTYDPIRLSDIDSDDEWITEKDDPCLPNDVSWMDIHESFTLKKEAPSKKRKRGIYLNYKTCTIKLIINFTILIIYFIVSLIGSRNLNTKVDKKRKSTIIANDNEIEGIVEEEEEEEEDENDLQENVILVEEDDLSDIDLEDDE